MSTLYMGSTLAQGVILLLGGVVMLSYGVSVVEQAFQDWSSIVTTQDLVQWTGYLFFQLSLIGFYGLVAYFVVAEEMSDPGFRALEQLLGNGI